MCLPVLIDLMRLNGFFQPYLPDITDKLPVMSMMF
jgi:hypothetical protein